MTPSQASSQASKTFRIRVASGALTLLLASLAVSTFIHSTPRSFFGFALTNGVLQSCINSYFQTSIVAIASWFGPSAIQSMFSGQAAVAVVISALQLLSAAASIDDIHLGLISVLGARSSVDRSATTFFLIMMAGMVVAILAHTYLTRLPIYKEVAQSFEQDRVPDITEGTALLSETLSTPVEPSLRVGTSHSARANDILAVRPVLSVCVNVERL